MAGDCVSRCRVPTGAATLQLTSLRCCRYRDLRPEPPTTRAPTVRRSSGPAATVFIDDISNVTWATSVGMLGDRITGSGTYFEGTNKVVYVRGTEDEDGEWWKSDMTEMRVLGRGGVLVNAHYDSYDLTHSPSCSPTSAS